MVASHKTQISEMDGLGRAMPITFIAFLIGSLSVIGLPPFGGAWSKWYLMLASAEAGYTFFMIVFMISSLLNIAYLMPIVGRGFFVAGPGSHIKNTRPKNIWLGLQIGKVNEAPLLCLVAMILSSLGCIALFIFADSIFQLLLPIAGDG